MWNALGAKGGGSRFLLSADLLRVIHQAWGTWARLEIDGTEIVSLLIRRHEGSPGSSLEVAEGPGSSVGGNVGGISNAGAWFVTNGL